MNDEITVFPKPANLNIYSDSKAVTVQKKSNKTTSFWVNNDGDLAGSASLTTESTPDGISVVFSPSTITDLKSTNLFGTSEKLEATVVASSLATLGDHEVNVELRNSTHIFDTMTLDITVKVVDMPMTTIPTTSEGTSTPTSSTTPANGETAPGFAIIGLILSIGFLVILRRKR